MKKVYIINICVLLIIFLTAGFIAKPQSQEDQIKTLISQRIEILNDYYDCKSTFNQAKDDLEKIESGAQFKQDVEGMKAFMATDIDKVREYKIRINSAEETSYGLIKGEAQISWVLETYSGLQKNDSKYFYSGEINKKKIKLTQLKIL